MPITLRPIRSRRELRQFVTFPWRVNRGDPCRVPPLVSDRQRRLDPAANPFWRELWMAWDDGRPLGTLAAIVDPGGGRALAAARAALAQRRAAT